MRVLLGVTGGIAAFKAVEIVRELARRGHRVRCALTRGAESFVTPLSLEVVSGEPVYREEYLSPTGTGEELHIAAAEWAEVLCVAPATAHTLGRMALGLADDFLTTTVLAFTGPVVVAPAMHTAMWRHEAVRGNVERLRARGVRLVGPVVGPLASGEVGEGRMAEPVDVVRAIEAAGCRGTLTGRKVLVTAGPTREGIDPVRYLSNRSSGRMGFALASAAACRGAETVLVAGPVDLPTPPGVRRIDVKTARQMAEAVAAEAPDADLAIMAAAVSDYRPREEVERKHKKSDGALELDLVENPDILASLVELAPHALRVGFAAETENVESEALAKLERKGAHFIVANDVSRPDIGFDSDDNEVRVYGRDGSVADLARAAKREIARRLLDLFEPALPAAAERRADGGGPASGPRPDTAATGTGGG